jgi:chromosome segregation ATPase
MTQAIEFDDLITAFAPERAIVTPIHRQPVQQTSATEPKVAAETETLSAHNRSDLEEQFTEMEAAYKKSLSQVSGLMLENMKLEKELSSIHESKMRMIRSLKRKQEELEDAQRQYNSAVQETKAVAAKLQHSKVDLTKATAKNQQLAKENQSQLTVMKQMSREIAELKKQHSLSGVAKTKLIALINRVKATLIQRLVDLTSKIPTQSTEPKLQWHHVSKALPKKQCVVFVRNGYESDMAMYYPNTRRFKCANSNFAVLEWARAQ